MHEINNSTREGCGAIHKKQSRITDPFKRPCKLHRPEPQEFYYTKSLSARASCTHRDAAALA